MLPCTSPMLTWKLEFVLPGELLGSWWADSNELIFSSELEIKCGGSCQGSCLLLKKHQGFWGCPCCNRENRAVVSYHMDERCLGENQGSRAARSERRREDAVIADLIATTCKAQTNTFTKCCHYVLFCALESDLAVSGEWNSCPKQKQFALWRMHWADWVMSVGTGGRRGGWRDPVLLPLCLTSSLHGRCDCIWVFFFFFSNVEVFPFICLSDEQF